ncbi:MAG: EamA family transporter [Actinomycetia bacterium]|nr:EamA family transporter [Actinomycetes bacterium]
MAVTLSLLAAVCYGVADFFGGLASRHRSAATVVLYSFPIGAVLMFALLPAFPGSLSGRTALFGTVAGALGMGGVVIMYGAMAVAPLNIISPVTAVLAAAVPVAFGVFTGERPATIAWGGILLGLVAVVLVSRVPDDHPHGPLAKRVLVVTLVAGVAFGLYFVLLARADSNSGLWPLAIARASSGVLVVPTAWRMKAFQVLRGRVLVMAVITGILDASANLFFLQASRHGLLSLASVISSLYPAATVLLAIMILREHTGRLQRVGLALAAAAIILITR